MRPAAPVIQQSTNPLTAGKSPVVVDPACDLKMAARRILWGKVVNAGQTCVAPDYILVPRAFQDTLCAALKATYEEFFPDKAAASASYSRIVSPQATARIAGMLAGTKGSIVFGGEVDAEKRFIAPTLVRDVEADDSLMSECVFDPLYARCSVLTDRRTARSSGRCSPLCRWTISTRRSSSSTRGACRFYLTRRAYAERFYY